MNIFSEGKFNYFFNLKCKSITWIIPFHIISTAYMQGKSYGFDSKLMEGDLTLTAILKALYDIKNGRWTTTN
jgi:hypothetical protein